jgi:hypothetical protein
MDAGGYAVQRERRQVLDRWVVVCEEPTRLWQFNLRELLLAVALIAVLFGAAVGTGGILWRMVAPAGFCGYAAIGLLLVAWWLTRGPVEVDIICGVLLISWHLVLIDTVGRILDGLVIINGQTWPPPLLLGVYRAVLAEILIPVVLTGPIVIALLDSSRGSPTRATRRVMLSTILAAADVILMALWIVSVLGYRVLRSGAADWSLGLD